jgi:FixJ family two-component response regulator
MHATPLVAIVDDDVSVRESLPDLIRHFGYSTRAFVSAEDFLASGLVDMADCLVLDIAMPGMTGPELHLTLKHQQRAIPVIFISGQADENVCRELLRQGAVACLSKPLNPDALAKALETAAPSN